MSQEKNIPFPESSEQQTSNYHKRSKAESELQVLINEWSLENNLNILEIAVLLSKVTSSRSSDVLKWSDDAETNEN